MLITILLILAGFLLLLFGGNSVVKASTALAKKLHISTLVIGITIVAFGTSIPELFITATSTLDGFGAFAFSDIIGSNIANSLLILGVAIAIRPINAGSKVIHKMLFTLSIFSVLFWLLADKIFLLRLGSFNLGKIESSVLLIAFVDFVYTLVKKAIIEKNEKELVAEYKKIESTLSSKVFITLELIFGLVALLYGSRLVVENAVLIAQMYNLSETYIGLTILTLGTSLPELATVIIASAKNEGEIILGNIIGSNIFNLAFVLGISGLIGHIATTDILRADTVFMILIIFVLHFVSDVKKLYTRRFGYCLIITYLLYFFFIFLRG